jgi:ATP-dependent Clp protease ATP-binding subunit ClpA
MMLRLSEDARRLLLTHAAAEASRRGDQRIGTDHLLLALLADPTSDAARALGVDLATARASADELDRSALAALGIHLRAVTDVEAGVAPRRLAPLTSGARAVLKRTIETARPTKTGRIESRHFLLALLECARPDPAAELLTVLDIDPAAVRSRLSVAPGEAR